jgi:adenylate cyclase
MSATRKLAAILVADVVGYSQLAGADEDRTLARLRGLRSDLIDPAVAVHCGHVVKRTGDGSIIEFRSVVDAVRCAIEMQTGMVERNAGLPPERRIEFRVGVHLGDVVEESDGDLMGDGVNIAARLEGVCEPGGICVSAAAYDQVRDRLSETFIDLGEKQLKNIARPLRAYALKLESGGVAPAAKAPTPARREPPRLSLVVLPFGNISGDPEQDYFVDGVTESLTTDLSRISGTFVIAAPRPSLTRARRSTCSGSGASSTCATCSKAACSARKPYARQRAADGSGDRQAAVGRALRQAAGRPLRHAGRDRVAARQPA